MRRAMYDEKCYLDQLVTNRAGFLVVAGDVHFVFLVHSLSLQTRSALLVLFEDQIFHAHRGAGRRSYLLSRNDIADVCT